MKATENQCNAQQCPCMDICPLGEALNRIGGKWKLRILCALMQDGTTRYGVLKNKVRGITNTMLASSLKELEQDGLVLREQYAEVPLRVEYTATERCKELMPILMQLAQWEISSHGERQSAAQ